MKLDEPFQWTSPDEVHLWHASVDEWREDFDRLVDFLDAEELARAARYRFDDDRNLYLLGRGLLRWLGGAYRGRDPRRLRFATLGAGKPYFVSEQEDTTLEFNLSNSRGRVVCAFSPQFSVGVDIEPVRVLDDLTGLARRYFALEEQADLEAIRDEAARRRYFFVLWTLKESYLKGTAAGLTTALDSFFVRADNDLRSSVGLPQAASLRLRETGGDENWRLFAFSVATDFPAALAVRCGVRPPQIKYRSARQAWDAACR